MAELLVLFDGSYYKQVDRIAMGSLLGPTLADLFLFLIWNYSSQIALLISDLLLIERILTAHFCCLRH